MKLTNLNILLNLKEDIIKTAKTIAPAAMHRSTGALFGLGMAGQGIESAKNLLTYDPNDPENPLNVTQKGTPQGLYNVQYPATSLEKTRNISQEIAGIGIGIGGAGMATSAALPKSWADYTITKPGKYGTIVEPVSGGKRAVSAVARGAERILTPAFAAYDALEAVKQAQKKDYYKATESGISSVGTASGLLGKAAAPAELQTYQRDLSRAAGQHLSKPKSVSDVAMGAVEGAAAIGLGSAAKAAMTKTPVGVAAYMLPGVAHSANRLVDAYRSYKLGDTEAATAKATIGASGELLAPIAGLIPYAGPPLQSTIHGMLASMDADLGSKEEQVDRAEWIAKEKLQNPQKYSQEEQKKARDVLTRLASEREEEAKMAKQSAEEGAKLLKKQRNWGAPTYAPMEESVKLTEGFRGFRFKEYRREKDLKEPGTHIAPLKPTELKDVATKSEQEAKHLRDVLNAPEFSPITVTTPGFTPTPFGEIPGKLEPSKPSKPVTNPIIKINTTIKPTPIEKDLSAPETDIPAAKTLPANKNEPKDITLKDKDKEDKDIILKDKDKEDKDIILKDKDKDKKDKDKEDKDKDKDKDKEDKDKRRFGFPFGWLGGTPPTDVGVEDSTLTPEFVPGERYGVYARRGSYDPFMRRFTTQKQAITEGKLSEKESLQRKVKKQKYKISYIQDGKKVEVFASSIRGVRRVVYGKNQYRVHSSSGADVTGYFKKLLK